jgi:uncharacterized membrane protein
MVLGIVVALAGFVGCNTSERGGKKDDNTKGSETFRLKGPATATTIKQGDKQTIKLTVDRGRNFKKDVMLKAEPPKDLKVNMEPATVKASDPETATMSISADRDAAVGEHTIKVIANPAEGNAVNIDVKVNVEKKAS